MITVKNEVQVSHGKTGPLAGNRKELRPKFEEALRESAWPIHHSFIQIERYTDMMKKKP